VGEYGTILKTTNGGTGLTDLYSNPNHLKLYPNPTSTNITIETTAKGHLCIPNLNGKELLHQEITPPSVTLDVSSLPTGVYFVRLTGEKSVQVGKFIKQ
jgi:hypothetical protein